jgi:hypothetical protein
MFSINFNFKGSLKMPSNDHHPKQRCEETHLCGMKAKEIGKRKFAFYVMCKTGRTKSL